MTPEHQQAEREASMLDFLDEPDNGPPLLGRWHHGNGVLVSGGIRIAQWDCDTNPPKEFRDRVLDWVCEALNQALRAGERADVVPPAQADYCRYGVCKPGERHVPGCAEYTATEIAASQDSAKEPK